MLVVTHTGKQAQAQIASDYKQQMADYEERQDLTYQYSTLISVSNPRRRELIAELREVFQKYS